MSVGIVDPLRRISLGVDIVGVGHESDRDAFTAGAIAWVSYEPLILALATNRQHASYQVLWAAGAFR
jgi:flavin reductase (DIM6/NTAB) family NADH-FMN oxidoreductase RutF